MNSSTALGQAMDLVDEEDRAFGRVGQVGHDVHLLVERRPARDVQLDAQLVVQDGRERRLAQARAGRRRGCAAAARPASCAAARLIASRSATARWPMTSREPLRAELLVDRIGRPRARSACLGGGSSFPRRSLDRRLSHRRVLRGRR